MTKSLQEKAVSIKGKQYVLVSDRVLYFNETYPKGCIQTILLSAPDDARVVVRADVLPDGVGGRCFTGHSQAVVGEGMVNKTAALENAETSAVGRALAMMGIGVIESIASVDEINKATTLDGAIHFGAGIPGNEFNKIVDIYIATKTLPNGGETYELMSESQQNIIQGLKKSFKRTSN